MFSRKSKRALPSSFRLQIIALYVVLFGVTVFGFAAFLYLAFVRNHQREFDAGLYNYVVDIAHMVDPVALKSGHFPKDVMKEEAEKILPFSLGETLLQVNNMDGVVLAHSQSLEGRTLPPLGIRPERLRKVRTAFATIPAPSLQGNGPDVTPRGSYRRIVHLAQPSSGPELVIQVAVPMILLEREKEGLLAFFAVSIPFILILATLGGLWLSRRAMEPFTAIVAKAKDIEAHQLSERVPVPDSNDEIRELAETLNGLLDRLERAFQSQEAFIADASHQLKTPLSILLGEIETIRNQTGDPFAMRGFLDSAQQEVQHLASLVEELLMLARVDSGLEPVGANLLRFDEIALEAAGRLEALAKRRDARFLVSLDGGSRDDDFEILGDPQLLRVLVENLLENALKYSPPGEAVTVKLSDAGEELRLEVRDRGPGIPAPALPKVFDRFFRAETTRDRVSGSGLGLSLVKKVSELHGGLVRAANHPEGGALLTVVLPKSHSVKPRLPMTT